jgi:DNA polymerase-2
MSEAQATPESGFILTQDWEDRHGSFFLTYMGRGQRGPFELRFTTQPHFYIRRDSTLPEPMRVAERRLSRLTEFDRHPIDVLFFNSLADHRHARRRLRDQGIRTYESDIQPGARFLMDHFVHGSLEFTGQSDLEDGLRVFRDPSVQATDYLPSLSMLSLDIETGIQGQLYSVGIHFLSDQHEFSRVFMVGENIAVEDEWLRFVPTEEELISAFLRAVRELDPDVIIGWNVIGFDLAVLGRICERAKILFGLGRQGRQVQFFERAGQPGVYVHGRAIIDGPSALRGSFFRFENFRLETVARQLLGESKDIAADGESKVAEIERRFREDKPALAAYNLKDCQLVSAIFVKTRLIEIMLSRTRISGMLLDQLGRSVGAFEHFYLPRLHSKGFVAPDLDDVQATEHAAGGLVLTPQPGLHNHVAVFDFRSLYPSLIRTFKIDPLSRLRAGHNPLRTPVGTVFSRTEHILPDYITTLMSLRTKAQRQKNLPLSQAIKILMNSFYGVMGTPGCRLYHGELPSSITGTGQWVLRTTRDVLQSWGYQVLYGDTDSVFVQFQPADVSDPHAAGRALAHRVNAFLTKRLRNDYDVESYLELEFEKYYSRFYLPAARGRTVGASKRYAGLIFELDGTKRLDVRGLEIVRSDWTALARQFQEELLNRLFYDMELKSWIITVVDELRAGKYDDQLVYRKRLRRDVSEYIKSTPPHVKAARQLPEDMQPGLREIEYVITRRGPVPVNLPHDDLDYDHYVNHQLRPIGDSVLGLLGQSFDRTIDPQLSFWETDPVS